jgi:hypothetical protein
MRSMHGTHLSILTWLWWIWGSCHSSCAAQQAEQAWRQKQQTWTCDSNARDHFAVAKAALSCDVHQQSRIMRRAWLPASKSCDCSASVQLYDSFEGSGAESIEIWR